MIVDCHCHAGTGDGFRGPWDTEARIEPHLARARAAGIDLTVVFPVFNSDYVAANARLARIVRAYPDELIGFAAIKDPKVICVTPTIRASFWAPSFSRSREVNGLAVTKGSAFWTS